MKCQTIFSEFQTRRQAVFDAMPSHSAAILFSAPASLRNGDVYHPYRACSNFYYLTGFQEPHAVCLLLSDAHKKKQFILWNQPNDPKAEQWTGKRVGQKQAKAQYGADQALSIEDFSKSLPDLLHHCETLYFDFRLLITHSCNIKPITVFQQWLACHGSQAKKSSPINDLRDIRSLIYPQRLIKSPEEIKLIQKAVDITAGAHEKAMRLCKPGRYEYQIAAILQASFMEQGSHGLAYPSIVGSGKHSCILHYQDNHAQMQKGELLLVDAGAEYQYYAADITRTYPIDKAFSSEQRAIYRLVLDTQNKVIEHCKPGVLFSSLQTIAVESLSLGLKDLGILQGSLDEILETKAYRPFYPHSLGHHLGLDVHDLCDYNSIFQHLALQPGMVITIEPGLYLSDTIPQLQSRWHPIGVRIEDDVLITPHGCKVLSKHLPKSIEEIEALKRHAL